MNGVEQIPQAQLRTYTMNHPSLAPLVSEANEPPAAAINAGDVITDDHIAAASQQHTHRIAWMMSNKASELEVVASKKREMSLLLESVSTVPVGQDLAQALMEGMRQNTAALQQVNERLEQVNERLEQGMRENTAAVQQVNERLGRIENEVNGIRGPLTQSLIHSSRNTNSSLMFNEPIVPVQNNQGVLPPEDLFPQFQNDILTFYGVERARRSEDIKKSMLCSHLGLTYRVRT